MIMKKVFLLLFLTLVSVNAFSQITRTIWGATLGKSTMQEVEPILAQKASEVKVGDAYDKDNDDYYDWLSIHDDNIPFGGAFWTDVTFYFYFDVFDGVIFENVGPTANSIYEKIKKSLDSKYRQYFVDNHGDTGWNRYDDGKTRIGLKLDRSQSDGNTQKVMLFYEDRDFQKSVNGMDEL